ncbi:hypothetical protein U9M48_013743 [Paspalum notatum var. saurae]|uniref:Uncharacterized protein n=1 Tax=Paspalum notatum var. saurae TaxID=547442 RepID=A0AAQ3WK06_PASNO
MDGRLLRAAVTGDATLLKQLACDNPAVLLGTTPQGNTCLHISAIHGHEEFCRETVPLDGSLLDITNVDGETPLLTAVTRGRANLASVLLSCCLEQRLSETILKQDKHGCNALHHAVRKGQRELALELIKAEPALSQAVNERNESPICSSRLLDIPDSAHSGAFGLNVLHAAVRNGNSVVAKRVLKARSELVVQENENKHTPMHLAVNEGKVDVLTVLLEHDPSLGLGYSISTDGAPLLCIVASQGHVGVARELLQRCPDVPYCDANGLTCLHVAVSFGHKEFVEFVLGSEQLQHLINMEDSSGKTALHLAATNCRTDMVDAFLLHPDMDVTVLDNAGNHANKTINTVEDTASTSSYSSGASKESAEEDLSGAPMDERLLKAAMTGDATLLKQLASEDPAVLLGTTPQGNTCLHISAIHGHQEFCEDAVALNGSLLDTANADGETPLLTAVTRDHATLASFLLRCCGGEQLRAETVPKQDKQGYNALHHAICRGHTMLALELIEAEPALSKAVNKWAQSPMFVAASNNYGDVLDKLLEIPYSSDSGNYGFTALHAAARNGHTALVKRIVEKRPWLVRQESFDKRNPMHLAVNENKVDVLTVFLGYDRSLGYLISRDGIPLLCMAASQGHVGVARELLKHCPDAPYCDANGSTCLHAAVSSGNARFVEFVLRSQQLQHLIIVTDNGGQTPLDLASSDTRDMQEAADIVALLQNHLNNLGLHRHLEMDQRLLEAATSGHSAEMRHLENHVPGVLLGTTPQGNTCLHIASIQGHDRLCEDVQNLEPSLLSAINLDGETPLLAAVACGHVSAAAVLLRWCRERQLSETILKQDKHGCNVLHHIIRRGHRKLALELVEAEPALSHAVNQYDESPMFIAVMGDYEDVFDVLLEIPGSAHGGACGDNALHAAVRNDNSAIARRIMEKLPELAREENNGKYTMMQAAVVLGKIDVLRVLLSEHDRSLGYVVSTVGIPLLNSAALRGHTDVARQLLKYSPDAANCRSNGWTCLHEAVQAEQTEFVEFAMGSPQLAILINMRDSKRETPLHVAVRKCNPKVVAALLLHPHTGVTVPDNNGNPACYMLPAEDHAKTLNWNEVIMLMMKADPQEATSVLNLYKEAKNKIR